MTTINHLDPVRISAGVVPGVRFVEMIGRNPDIDTATVPESIWPVGGLLTFRAAAAVVEVISSSVEDDPDKGASVAGTGAWSIRVWGLDANYNEITEDITLNGTAAVVGTKLFLRINDAHVLTKGTGGTNAGNVTIRDASAGTARSYIAASRGSSEIMVYTVPAGHKLLMDGWYVTARDASGVSAADIDFHEVHNAESGADHVAWSMTVDKVFVSPFDLPHPFAEKTDIYAVVTVVDANNTVVSWHGHGTLIGPNADI